MAENILKHLTCPICLGLYKSPKLLPCVHSFCDSCLNEYIRKSHTISYRYAKFECPVCRASTGLGAIEGEYADVDVNSSTGWTKKFPANHQLVAMVDDFLKGQRATYNSDDKLNEKFEPCFAAGRGSFARCLCLNCFEFLCDGCQMNHKLFKQSKNHTVPKKDELPDDVSLLRRMHKLGLCKNTETEKYSSRRIHMLMNSSVHLAYPTVVSTQEQLIVWMTRKTIAKKPQIK